MLNGTFAKNDAAG